MVWGKIYLWSSTPRLIALTFSGVVIVDTTVGTFAALRLPVPDGRAELSDVRVVSGLNLDPRLGKSQVGWGGGGAKWIVRFRWGKRTIERPLQKQFWRPQKVGFVWSVPASSKEMTGREQGGGGTYHRRGVGVQNPFWGGGPVVCFPLPWVLHPPFAAL